MVDRWSHRLLLIAAILFAIFSVVAATIFAWHNKTVPTAVSIAGVIAVALITILTLDLIK